MYISECFIVVRQTEAKLVPPAYNFLARVKRCSWRDYVIIKKVLCALPTTSAARFCQMCQIIERNQCHEEDCAADTRSFQPSYGRSGICVDVIVVTPPAVDAKIKVTARTQNAHAFGKCFLCIRRMMNNSIRDNNIETVIVEGERHCRCAHETYVGRPLPGSH